MRYLLSCAAAAALTAGTASAQMLPNINVVPAEGVDAAALEAQLAGAALDGWRVENDECMVACDAAGGFTEGTLLSRASADATDGSAPTAPRIDLSTDGTVDFRGNKRGLKRFRTGPQVIYLKLDNDGSPQFPVDLVDAETGAFLGQIFVDDYVYSAQDKAEIRDRIAADYAEFNVEVVTTPPANGEFATVDFTDNDRGPEEANITLFLFDDGGASFSILFGRAEGIDFGNDDYSNGGFADANFWVALSELFSPASFTALTGGLPATPEGLRTAVINQSANTGAHEVGHAVGLRHHDSFGAPDDGLTCDDVDPVTGAFLPGCTARRQPGDFIPVYDGPQQGTETLLHTMASGASVGLSLAGSSNQDRFFSERSAVKLQLAEHARVYAEGVLADDGATGAKRLDLKRTMIPSTILEGENSGGNKIAMDTAWVQGTLDGLGDVDEYVFQAKRTKFINAELISFSDSFIENPVIATLNVFKLNADGSREFVSSNSQTFEPFDPLLLDIEVPEFGDYILQVVPQQIVFLPAPLDLNQPGLSQFLQGDYDLIVYQVDRALGSAPRVGG